MSVIDAIRLKGVQQNNLKGFDLNIPLGQLVVVTGISGAGKSSLVFETLHAEGQRRYVETFSPYVRQFLEMMDRPRVTAIENIHPSIAIEQGNTVRTSRSTVGTMTELCDFMKVWFCHRSSLIDPTTGEIIEDDNAITIWNKVEKAYLRQTVLIAFRVTKPSNFTWKEVIANVRAQGFTRVIVNSTVVHLDSENAPDISGDPTLVVVQDRLIIERANRQRFIDSASACLHFGQGELLVFDENAAILNTYSEGLRSSANGRHFRKPSPALFSFHSPVGACPTCRGFGRVIEIDYRLVIPDGSLSLSEGAIRAFMGDVYGRSQEDLLRACRRNGVRTNVAWDRLSTEEKSFVRNGEPGYVDENDSDSKWYGIDRFFAWLEENVYKMHVRVFLSRFRSYALCPSCAGARLQPEAMHWHWISQGARYTLPDLYRMPVDDLRALLANESIETRNRQLEIATTAILTRLRYLCEVGLGYLTLDRASRTLSGGETQRVALTASLGSCLVDTLFVLDEPSIGLHARDLSRLITILRQLVAQGNSVVVVEHDESVMRAADLLIEVGPSPGSEGGRIVFIGSPADAMKRSATSLTAQYLRGERTIQVPSFRRTVHTDDPHIAFQGVTKHNLRNLDISIPLNRLVALSGVSGAGKSTLLNNVIYQGLLMRLGRAVDDPATIDTIQLSGSVQDVVLIDQTPISRTPRSNPALFVDAWDPIRKLFAKTDAARGSDFTASCFSFNSRTGRCPHCNGLGFERIEMQFMADVFVVCPVCEGERFQPDVLAVQWNGFSIANVLKMTVQAALGVFSSEPSVHKRLRVLEQVGLGYLTLGQPLNTLSGGESQRLKLVKYLSGLSTSGPGTLILLDEPTTGLHREDVRRLLDMLQALVSAGNSVVVIEHQMDVLRSSDWIIELGPEAGERGGRLIFEGTPEALASTPSPTAQFMASEENPALIPFYDASSLPAVAEDAKPYNSAALRTTVPTHLSVSGAREHNLQNISVDVPLRELTVITGVSGSGKSSLAFDIIFAEGQRRFMESMSAWARQYVEQLPRPEVDHLSGVPPTVSIEQRVTAGTGKSTVATITEVAQYIRLLFARLGIPHNPKTGNALIALDIATLATGLDRRLRTTFKSQKNARLFLCAPVIRGRKGHHQPLADWATARGYSMFRIDGKFVPLKNFERLDRYREHDIELVIAAFRNNGKEIIADIAPSNDQMPITLPIVEDVLRDALQRGNGACFVADASARVEAWYSTMRADPETGESFPELDPKHFSWNSPKGWCPTCHGHGEIQEWMYHDADYTLLNKDRHHAGHICSDCEGTRLNSLSRSVRLYLKGEATPASGKKRRASQSLKQPSITLPELLQETPVGLLERLRQLETDRRGAAILAEIRPEIEERMRFMARVGLDYLGLDRATATLSGGEAQRIRLAAQLGSNLSGVLYVLDEPSIGLHARDNERLLASLEMLKEKGNTVIVVEHDADTIRRADNIIELGPAAGRNGGQLIFSGNPTALFGGANGHSNRRRRNPATTDSLTARYLRDGIAHPRRGHRRPLPQPWNKRSRAKTSPWMILEGAALRNLKGFTLTVPKGRFIAVCGISGAGKSTLVRDVLMPSVSHAIRSRAQHVLGESSAVKALFKETVGNQAPFHRLHYADDFRRVIEVDQSPIGKTPRSTPATYIGIFDAIRRFFSTLPEARILGCTPGTFSFNTPGGRCETCKGAGRVKLEMSFMPDTYVTCETCSGSRYGPQLDAVRWNGRSITEVLDMTFEEAASFFDFHATLRSMLHLMVETGLGYLTLGQISPTLSGGEAQRLKLVSELVKGIPSKGERDRGDTKRNLYLLEEPTIGLHLADCVQLIDLLHRLVDDGHTVIVIEHHLDVIAEADYVVEIGPEGGERGGHLLYQGPPEGMLDIKNSPTAPYLRSTLIR